MRVRKMRPERGKRKSWSPEVEEECFKTDGVLNCVKGCRGLSGRSSENSAANR